MSSVGFQRPDTGTVLRTIGAITFKEITRDRVLYNAVLCAMILIGIAFFVSKLSFIKQDRVILDFGLAAVDLSCGVIAVLIGASLVSREFDRRTVYVALAKPISRIQFMLGKYVGLVSVLVLNWALLSLSFTAVYLFVGGDLSAAVFWGLFLIFFKSALLGAVVFFFSIFSTASLSVILSFGIFFIGSNISQVQYVANRMETRFGKTVLDSLTYILPDLERFSLGTQVTYGLPVDPDYILGSVLYCGFYVGMLLFFSGFLIHHREI